MLRVDAPAKINLSLQVIGRRPDGYHELRSVLQTVTVLDTLTFVPAADTSLHVSDPVLQTPDNLVLRAAEILQRRTGQRRGVEITLDKHIPHAAGLGGGSSDAATTVLALDRLWGTHLGKSDRLQVAAELGSDVPFFLVGGTARVAGRGEIVEALPRVPETWYVLVKPAFAVSTAAIFRALQPNEWSDGEATEDLVKHIRMGGTPRFGPNDLMAPLFRLYSEARDCYDLVLSLRPDDITVSGSGATIVGLFHDPERALDAARRIEGIHWVRVAMPYHHRED